MFLKSLLTFSDFSQDILKLFFYKYQNFYKSFLIKLDFYCKNFSVNFTLRKIFLVLSRQAPKFDMHQSLVDYLLEISNNSI